MKKTPKNILIITLILALLTSLSNYSNSSKNIDELAYIMAIAIDIGTSAKYKITMQISTVESTSTEALTQKSSEDSSGGQSKKGSKSNYPNIKINTIEADSLDTAINIANAFVNKDISLSHCKILVISEELAKQGIKNIVNSTSFIDSLIYSESSFTTRISNPLLIFSFKSLIFALIALDKFKIFASESCETIIMAAG